MSVMPQECLLALDVKPSGTYVDGTLGGAGHASLIYSKLGREGRLIGIDRDQDAIDEAQKRLLKLSVKGQTARLDVVKANFLDIESVMRDLNVGAADGILLDLGVSSWQLDSAERGFSFKNDAPLDMRMDRASSVKTAADIVNGYSETELRRTLFDYGEERYSSRIARKIVETRAKKPIATTRELAGIIVSALPADARHGRVHAATRSFLALRCEVNGEISALPDAVDACLRALAPEGRLCALTFHSVEDRIVKERLKRACANCVCPKEAPVCVCGHRATARKVFAKPLTPTASEISENPRSRSAKLRVVERLTV